MDNYAAGEMDRRLGNMVRIGTVAEFDPAQGVKVDLGELVTDWLPIGTRRSGKQRSWNPMDIGEQVVVAAPDGEISQGVVLCSIPQEKHPANGDKAGLWRETFDDGTVLEYDQASKALKADIASAGSMLIKVGGSTITIDNSGITLVGGGNTLTVNGGGVRHNGTNIGESHVHGGILPGGADTLTPH